VAKMTIFAWQFFFLEINDFNRTNATIVFKMTSSVTTNKESLLKQSHHLTED
jgi:hypothetical protein